MGHAYYEATNYPSNSCGWKLGHQCAHFVSQWPAGMVTIPPCTPCGQQTRPSFHFNDSVWLLFTFQFTSITWTALKAIHDKWPLGDGITDWAVPHFYVIRLSCLNYILCSSAIAIRVWKSSPFFFYVFSSGLLFPVHSWSHRMFPREMLIRGSFPIFICIINRWCPSTQILFSIRSSTLTVAFDDFILGSNLGSHTCQVSPHPWASLQPTLLRWFVTMPRLLPGNLKSRRVKWFVSGYSAGAWEADSSYLLDMLCFPTVSLRGHSQGHWVPYSSGIIHH